ncbi:MAG: tail fiber domain-containing protein [Dinghuibacter sp.]|nr:tail fiber domain-containing protein [Dinghuibacter sp.]
MRSKKIPLHSINIILVLLLVKTINAQYVGIGLPGAAARAQLEVLGSGGLRVHSTNTGTGITDWIAGNFGYSPSGDRVVMGNLLSTATIGAHNNTLTAWAPVHINYAGIGGPVNISMADTTYLGNTIISSLAGAGNRMVTINNTGAVSSQPIPVQPTINGSNGLVAPGNMVQLGGVLTQTTTISQNNYSLRFNNASGDANLIVVNGRVGVNMASPNYSLQVNGTMAGNAAYISLSDERFKTNIRPIHHAVQKMMKLRGVHFNWNNRMPGNNKNDNEIHTGFIAQELEQVLPQAVIAANDRFKTRSVAYSEVIPVLVEVIKQQQKQTLRQQQEINELKRILQQPEKKN